MLLWKSALLFYTPHHPKVNCYFLGGWRVQWKNTGGLKQKHKKQPFSDASASHLSLVLRHVWFQAEAWISHTTSPTPPSYEVGGIAKRIKTARLRRKTNLQKSDYPKTQIKRYPNSFCIAAGFISHRSHRFHRFFFDSVKSHRVCLLLIRPRVHWLLSDVDCK